VDIKRTLHPKAVPPPSRNRRKRSLTDLVNVTLNKKRTPGKRGLFLGKPLSIDERRNTGVKGRQP